MLTSLKYRDSDAPSRPAVYDRGVAQPAPQAPAAADDDPPIDPAYIELRYRHHRARRQRRVLQRQESRLAHYRFYIALAVLIALAAAFVVGSWHEIQHLFGL